MNHDVRRARKYFHPGMQTLTNIINRLVSYGESFNSLRGSRLVQRNPDERAPKNAEKVISENGSRGEEQTLKTVWVHETAISNQEGHTDKHS